MALICAALLQEKQLVLVLYVIFYVSLARVQNSTLSQLIGIFKEAWAALLIAMQLLFIFLVNSSDSTIGDSPPIDGPISSNTRISN